MSCWTKEESDFFRKIDNEVIKNDKPILNLEETQKQLNGEQKTLLTSKVPLRNKSGKIVGILGIYTDITDRKNIELEKDQALLHLKKIQEKLIEAEKLRSLGQLAGGIAHEINNPLAIIAGKNLMIKKLTDKDNVDLEKIKTYCDEISATIKRITNVIQNLKDISHSHSEEEKKNSSFPVLSAYSNVIKLINLDEKLRKKLNITVNIPTEAKIYSNQISYEQALFNIIDNAIFEQKNSDSIIIEINLQEKDDHLLLKITNPGQLISTEVRNKLFEPYFTTKPIGSGTGLGLSICKNLMKKCGGDIFYEVNNDQNSFIIIASRS